MFRSLVVAVLIVGIGASALVLYRWWGGHAGDQPASMVHRDNACYPLDQACHWQTDAGRASVSMDRLDGNQLAMTVELPAASGPVIAVLTGESMYMGEYPLRLEQVDTGVYQTQFVPPFCSTGADMVWRVNLRAGPRDITPPVALLFRSG